MLSQAILIASLLLHLVSGQSYSILNPPPSYSAGKFIVPDNTVQQIYDEGTLLNVTWSTSIVTGNLFLVKGGDYDNALEIASTITKSWINVALNCIDSDCTQPYGFDLMDAESKNHDDPPSIWSGRFWIRPRSKTAAMTTTSSTSASSSATASLSSGTSTPSANSNSNSTAAAAAASASPPAGAPSGGLDNSAKIGIGVGVGVGALAACAAILTLLRRRANQKGAYKPAFQEIDYEWPAAAAAGAGAAAGAAAARHTSREVKYGEPIVQPVSQDHSRTPSMYQDRPMQAYQPNTIPIYHQQQTEYQPYSRTHPIEAPTERDPAELL